MCIYEHDNYDSQEYYDDRLYDEIMDYFFLIACDADSLKEL